MRRPILFDQADTVLLGVGYCPPKPKTKHDLAIGPNGETIDLTTGREVEEKDIDRSSSYCRKIRQQVS